MKIAFLPPLLKITTAIAIVLCCFQTTFSQTSVKKNISIEWQQPQNSNLFDEGVVKLYFKTALYESPNDDLPFYTENIPIHSKDVDATITISNAVTEIISTEEGKLISSLLENEFTITHSISTGRNNPFLNIKIIPLRKNGNLVEKLISCTLDIILTDNYQAKSRNNIFATESVLKSGNWYKFKISKTGIYKISYSDLSNMGISPSNIDPRNIRIYGNGGGLLPESNGASFHDDLTENPIYVHGENDGKFDNNDYILFYSRGPVTWNYNTSSQSFERVNNAYDDYTYLFITTDLGAGKRIEAATTLSGSNIYSYSAFLDYQYYETDDINLSNMGRTWFCDVFDATLSRNYSFTFPNVLKTKSAKFKTEVASRNFDGAAFDISIDGVVKRTLSMPTTSTASNVFANTSTATFNFDADQDLITVNLKYNRSSNSNRGWLDYITVNAWRELKFTGSQMCFRNPEANIAHTLSQFSLSNANSSVQIWDVTNPTEAKRINTASSGNTLTFISDGNELKEFIAFDGNDCLSVEFVQKVENQNLHAIRDIDYLIISYPDFISQAERIAELHLQKDGLKSYITTPELIYNEFSCGATDISAIRNFARMLYSESSAGRELRYLLFLGDASFDYKNRDGINTFVPTFESVPSTDISESFATDDYYGLLDDGEGYPVYSGLLDIGIGRFPVKTLEEATSMVNKIETYLSQNENTMRPWRNLVTLITDDADGNSHTTNAERLERDIKSTEPALNFDKIYLDAYQQISTPNGKRAPSANEAINKRIDKGTLIINYVGHGGEIGWTVERILEISDIQSWRNIDNLPLFITATCEFSRFDDHTRTSAGEMVFLNENGGAIAMITTVRLTFAGANQTLNLAIYNDNLFALQNGEPARLGDVIRKSKTLQVINDRKFILFGDPALQLTYPQLNVETTKINGNPVESFSDTLKALETVTIEGRITDSDGNPINDYQGIIYTSVYDKANEITSFGDESEPFTFSLQNSIIYNGKASVTDGQFAFSFIVPKDISYKVGQGRISYYATNNVLDANGYFDNVKIGAYSESTFLEEEPPHITLFIDDTLFVSGSITNESPLLLAFVSDESGINTTGTGIGHNITATIDGATTGSYILNDYFETELDNNSSGDITYRFSNLNPGKHTLTLKVWDIFNNSNSETIEFEVVQSSSVAISNLKNYPNPFSAKTYFVFDHNQVGYNFNVEIQIFDITGRLIHVIKESMNGSSTRSNPICWDGNTSNGSSLRKGLYIYSVIITNENGEKTAKQGKLIYSR